MLPNIAHLIRKTIQRNLNYDKYVQFVTSLTTEAWFFERLCFKVIIIMVKDKKNSIKDTMSIKITFIHYLKWSGVMLPKILNFKEFELVRNFLLSFIFSLPFILNEVQDQL